jgi:PAS domain S-box-containing protein
MSPKQKKTNPLKNNIQDLFDDLQKAQQPAEASGNTAAATARGSNLSPDTLPVKTQVKKQGKSTILAAPIRISQDEWGELQVLDEHAYWTDDDRLLIEQVADQLSLALQNARLLQETRRRAEELELINRIGRIAGDYSNINQTLEKISEEIATNFNLAHVGFALLDSEQKSYVIASAAPLPKKYNPLGQHLPTLLPLIQTLQQTKDTIVLPNADQRALPEPVAKTIAAVKARTLVIMPVFNREEIVGIALLYLSDENRILAEHEVRLLETILGQIATSIQNARLLRSIQESEARFRDVALASADWVWEIDALGFYTYCSDRVRDVLGYEPDEIIGRRPVDFIPLEDMSTTGAAFLQLLESRAPIIQFEIRNRTRDGNIVILEADGIPIFDEHNHLRGYRGVYKNITERRNAEKLQNAIYQITEAALSTDSLQELMEKIHVVVRDLVPADNFYIALYDPETQVLRFPYFRDEKESAPPDVLPLGNGLTSHIIQTGKPLLVSKEELRSLREKGVDVRGVESAYWLGLPLRTKDAIIGVMAIQTYDPDNRLTTAHLEIMRLLSTQVASALERFLAAEALARSESELRALFAAMDDVILVVDKDTTYLRIAPTNQAKLVMAPDELLGKRMTDIFDEPLRSLFQESIQTALQTGETQRIEYPIEINGETIWFDATISKLNENQVFWVARDITDRKHAEEMLRRRNEYLATAAEVGRLIASTLELKTLFRRAVRLIQERFHYQHVSIFTLNESGLEAVLREATGEVGEKLKEEAFSVPVGSKSVVGRVTEIGEPIVLNDVSESDYYQKHPLLEKIRSEAALPLKIGPRIIGVLDLQSEKANAFHEEDIAVLQILADQIAIAIDNARSYQLAQQAVREMREVDRLKSQFLANMSHELRTPLNSIIGFSRVILKGIDGPLTDLQKQDLTSIYNSGQHLLGLINDILDLSRIEAGKMELQFEEVNTRALIESVMSTARGLLKDKPVELRVNLPENLPTIRADQMRVRQVLLNLVSNAAKFTEEGSITITASVVFEEGRQMVRIAVTDTGPGISEEDQKKLFQPFSQVDASLTRKVGGSGLGLSISQALVHMHQGSIGLESEVGKGSTFYFTIPTWEQPAPEPQTHDGEKRILLAIDDDINVINLYQRYLQNENWEIVPVPNPTEALQKARELRPAAITLDIMMPELSGWDLLQALKKAPQTRDIPVIVCSIVEETEKGYALGAAEYLTKPILPDDLVMTLQKVVEEQERPHILVIDDNPDDLRLIEKALQENGNFHISLAESGQEGLNFLESELPDAILLDLFMPEMDGFAVLEALHSRPEWRKIPVVIITSGDLTAKEFERLEQFGLHWLQKSRLSPDDLIAYLKQELKRFANGK